MKRYIQPITEIVLALTSENILLGGSDDVEPIVGGDPIVVGGDDPDLVNSTSRSLWDED